MYLVSHGVQVIKNHFASEYIYNKYKDMKTCDVVEDNPQVRGVPECFLGLTSCLQGGGGVSWVPRVTDRLVLQLLFVWSCCVDGALMGSYQTGWCCHVVCCSYRTASRRLQSLSVSLQALCPPQTPHQP